jgi:hypothetical protein
MKRDVEDNNVSLRCGPPESLERVERNSSLGIELGQFVRHRRDHPLGTLAKPMVVWREQAGKLTK